MLVSAMVSFPAEHRVGDRHSASRFGQANAGPVNTTAGNGLTVALESDSPSAGGTSCPELSTLFLCPMIAALQYLMMRIVIIDDSAARASII